MTKIIRILESTTAPSGNIRYIDQVVTYAPDDLEFMYFSWKTALIGKFDVFHVHWPEALLRSSGSFIKDLFKRMAFRFFLLRLKYKKIPVVRTLHNTTPHTKATSSENKLMASLESLVSVFVLLNRTGTQVLNSHCVVIPHAEYSEVFKDYPQRQAIRNRILTFGRLEPYKRVDRIIDAFSDLHESDITLRIVGSGKQAIIADLSARAALDSRISTDFRYLSDADLVAEVTSAGLIVLAHQDMLNSGVAFVALSLGRPVIAPISSALQEIKDEIGDQWIYLYEGVISADAIREGRQALSDKAEYRGLVPDWNGRSWSDIAANYADVFRQLDSS